MKKIAVVSCYFQPNYGSVLQALATQMALDKLGCDNETIDISGFEEEINKAKIKYFVKASFTSGIILSKFGRVKNAVRKKFSKSEYSKNISIRNEQFSSFRKKYFKLSYTYSSMVELEKYCADNYSAVLVGSDQLWLPGNIAADYYTLNWVPDKINTIAYATSFGQSILPKDSVAKADIFLKKIKHISVREESGQKLIKRIVDRSVPVVCDPTLLFTGDEWIVIQKEGPKVTGRYIFCYFLGNNPIHREFVKKLKEELQCKVVILPHIDEYVKEDEEIADELFYDIDPGEFLNLIRYATYVCTDSFHCTVFSIQYKREFFAFKRFSDTSNLSTNDRLRTLMNITGINGRILVGNEKICDVISSTIEYKSVLKQLEKIRKKSYEYLKTALNDKKDTDLYN